MGGMRTRVLGGSGIEVGAIGLGCMGFTHGYDVDQRDDDRSVAVVHRALELGVTLLDTSDFYGPWTNEDQLHERAQRLRESLGLDALLLTRSEDGMSLFDAAGHAHVPAQAREVFDVTGAGDTVIATLAALLACGVGLRDALPIVNRAGGIVVGKFGTASVGYDELFA